MTFAPPPIHIWMFCGYAGSGKTHAARHLLSLLNPATTFVTAFADAVKDDVSSMYIIPRTLFDTQEGKASLVKTPDGKRKARDLLIDYSLAMKEAYGDAVWAEEVVRRIRSVVERRRIEHVIIHDLRFTAEVDTMNAEFGASQDFVPSVSNYNHTPLGCGELETECRAVEVQCNHTPTGCGYNWHSTVLHTIRIVRPSVASLPIPSEHDLDDYVTDITIENGGTVDELHAKIDELFRQIK
jgi:hypothetical protein